MPCEDPTHSHEWPEAGPAVFHIQNCERLCSFCPHPKNNQLFSDASNLRAHVDHLHLKDLPGITIISAVALRRRNDKEYAKVINAPPRNCPLEVSEMSTVGPESNKPPEDPTLPSTLRVRSMSAPQSKLSAIRDLLFLKAEHHNKFHLLAEYHLQQAQNNAPATNEDTLSLDAAASFLRIYGARLWSNDGAYRTHLTTVNTIQNYTYWEGSDEVADACLSGPCFTLHSVVSGRARRAWQDDQAKRAPLKTEELAYSKLGVLIRLYFSTLLSIGTVDESRGFRFKITTDPVQLLRETVGGEDTTKAPSKRKAMVALKLSQQPAAERQRSSSPDIPLSALIDEWRSTHRLTEPPVKRLKVARSEQSRKRPALGKIITSPLPASSARTEPAPVSSEMLARVQARRMSSTNQDGDSARVCVCPAGPKIRGPRNAYILYFQYCQSQISSERRGPQQQQEIAKIIGQQWRTLEVEDKKEWHTLADEEKKRHRAQYPHYPAHPKSGRRDPNLTEGGYTSGVQDPTCNKCGGVTISCPPSSKKPRTAYNLFFQRTHHQIVAEHPGLHQTEVVKIIGERWQALALQQKEEWKALANEEKRRHSEQNIQNIARRGRQSAISSEIEATFAVEKSTCSNSGGVAASSMACNGGNAHGSSPAIEGPSPPANISDMVRRQVEAEHEPHHHLNRPSSSESQAPGPIRRTPVRLSEAEVTRNQAELSRQPNVFQLPTPRSSVQEISPQSAFDRNLALHLSSISRSLSNAESMPPPARPWPTLPRQPDGYEFPRYGSDVWTPREEEETMSRMGLSGEMGIQQQLKSVDHFKAYEIAAGSLGGLPFC